MKKTLASCSSELNFAWQKITANALHSNDSAAKTPRPWLTVLTHIHYFKVNPAYLQFAI